MPTSVNMFNIGKSGMMATKASLSTTGHNISNANTDGYSRQEVALVNGPTIPSGKLTFGNGVRMQDVKRINDEYLERRLHMEAKNFGNVEEKDIYLQQTEQIFNESNNDGLNRLATKFFNEFRKLSSDPANEAIRASVREASRQLTSDFKRMDNSIKEVQKNIDTKIEGYVREINSLAKEIRDLNLLIQNAENQGSSAPDLCDQRDNALKKLGEYTDISVSKDNNSKITVTMNGHIALVNGDATTKLEVVRTPPDPSTGKAEGRLDLFVVEPVPSKVTNLIQTGRLGGLLEVRDRDIATAQKQIDEVAFQLAKGVNELHTQGFGKDGVAGRNFFEQPVSVVGAAENLQISREINSNLDAIAASSQPNAPSDNRMAIAISGLSSLKGEFGEDASILDKYNSMVSEIAVKTGANKKSLVFQKDVLTQLGNFREAQSGVSLDEETANLIKFQHAYAANAKVMQVADEIMTTLLGAFRGSG